MPIKKNKITFIDNSDGQTPKEYYPVPAKKELPSWYKSMNSFYETQDESQLKFIGPHGVPTIKKCMPVFDSISSGYLIKLTTDVVVFNHYSDSNPWYRWSNYDAGVSFHDHEQLKGHPMLESQPGEAPIAKFQNVWGIKTPPGYSCWVKNPAHRDLDFTILEGVVDTDHLNMPIEFPFLLKDPEWRGLIPAGTPIAQIIPFKRDSFVHNIVPKSKASSSFGEQDRKLRSVFNNGYKNFFWQRKSYD